MKSSTAVRILIFSTVFGVTVLIPGRLLGVSIALLRDIFSVLFLILIILSSRTWPVGQALFKTLAVLVAMIGLISVASLEEVNLGYVAPLYFRLLMLFLVIFFLASVSFSSQVKALLFRSIYAILGAYIVISLILYTIPFGRTEVGAMDGFAGQHFSKFIVVIAVHFYLTTLFQRPSADRGHRWQDIILLSLSALTLLLVLQRGALIAAGVGFLFYHNMMLGDRGPVTRVVVLTGAVIATVLLFSSGRFLEYAFFEQYGPWEIYTALLNGDFSWDMIRARGRFQILETITANADIGLIGNGLGVAKSIVSMEFFAGREPHNDFVMFAVDIGILGALSVLALLLLPVWLTSRANIPAGSHGAILLTSGKASLLGFIAWMGVSNVAIYLNYNFFLTAILILAGGSSTDPVIRNGQAEDVHPNKGGNTKKI